MISRSFSKMLIAPLALASVPASSILELAGRNTFPEEVMRCIPGNAKEARAPSRTGLYFGDRAFTAEHVVSVEPGFDALDERPTLFLRFSPAGAEQFHDLTRSNVGNMLPIFVDGDLIACPTVREPITGGEMQISGDYTPDSAALAANRIRMAVGIQSQP